jgi:hypothetical protein
MTQTGSDLVWVGAGALPFTVRPANLSDFTPTDGNKCILWRIGVIQPDN